MENPNPFLSLLDYSHETKIIRRLRDLLRDRSDLCFRPGSTDGSTFDLPPHGRIEVLPDCSPKTRRFFEWWCRAFRNRRDQKRDALTGLLRRSYFERRFKPEHTHVGASVAMADVDHFKGFNDDHGHEMGDRVLEAVGKRMRDFFGPRDTLVRYGGEEFLFLLDDPPSRAQARLDRFRDQLADQRLFEAQPRRITLSLGLSQREPEEGSIDPAIRRADRALYQSKRLGRNRLTRYAPYLDRRNRCHSWGMYRYLWEDSVRFCAGLSRRQDEFLMYRGRTLSRYRWNRDENRIIPCPDSFTHPVRCIRRSREGYFLLDGDGALWEWSPGGEGDRPPVRRSRSADPPLVELTGHGGYMRGVGLNNQRYRVGESGLIRTGSLPGHWERVLGLESFYVCLENVLIRWEQGGCSESWPMPEPVIQCVSDGEAGLVVGQSGGLYRFDPAARRWEQLSVGRLLNHPVRCREVSAHHGTGRMVVRDRNGRMLLVRRKRKSSPQRMNLEPVHGGDSAGG